MNPENESERALQAGDAAPDQAATATPEAEAAAARSGPTDVHAYIGRQLRAVYDDVAKQPIPDRFLELMRQLEGPGPKG